MPRPERPLNSEDSALLRFAADLRRLREKAGSPTYRQLAKLAHYSTAALSEAAAGRRLPTLPVTLAYVRACGGDEQEWEARWRELSGDVPAAALTETAPYVGLAAFRAEEADRFFGRERVVESLLARVGERRFLGLFGASGSGKTSVLRAGLIAELTERGAPVLAFTPGARPLEECAVRLAALTGQSFGVLGAELAADPGNLHLVVRQFLLEQRPEIDLVLVVDQFEEVFTLCQDPAERAGFIAALVRAAGEPTSRTRVVLGARADFFGHCGQYPELVEALADGQVLLGALAPEELRQVITRPAVRVGCTVETALVARIMADAAGQPAVLPMVSHALLETWRRRQGITLTLAGYEATGGIAHAIARTAEQTFEQLSPEQREVARGIFLRLVAPGEGTEDTARRITLDELDEQARPVLDRLAVARLITLDENTVQVAHEALIRCWPRLRGWVGDNRQGLRTHRHLTEATAGWESLHRDPGTLYRGARLAIARAWAQANPRLLTGRERTFLDASIAAEDAEQASARSHTARLRVFVAMLSCLLLVASTAVFVAIRAQQTTAEQRNRAIAQKVLGQAAQLRPGNPALSAQLDLAAYRLDPTPDARDAVLSAFTAPYASGLVGHTGMVRAVAYSPDGHTLASGDDVKSVRLWRVADPDHPQQLAVLPEATAGIAALAWSADGHLLAVGANDGSVRLWEVTDPAHPRQLSRFTTKTTLLYALAFSPNSHLLATGGSGTQDDAAQLWDLTDPTHPGPLGALSGQGGVVRSLAFSTDGRTLATGTDPVSPQDVHNVFLWDVGDPRVPRLQSPLADQGCDAYAVEFSPDGKYLATGELDNSVRVWALSGSGRPRQVYAFPGHTDVVRALAWTPDSHTLASGSDDGKVRFWHIPFGGAADTSAEVPTGSAVSSLGFSADGRILAVASHDRTIRLEQVADQVHPWRADTPMGTVQFSPDGQLLVGLTGGGGVQVRDLGKPGSAPVMLKPDTGQWTFDALAALAFRGHTLDFLTDQGTGVAIRSWPDGDPARAVQGEPVTLGRAEGVQLSAFSANGKLLAVTNREAGATVTLVDSADPAHPRRIGALTGLTSRSLSAAFSHDGTLLAVGGDDSTVSLWDISRPATPRRLATVPSHTVGTVNAAAFGPDEHTLVTSGPDNTMLLWDLTNPASPKRTGTLAGHADTVYGIVFSPDGHLAATSSADRSVRLWDVTDPRAPVEAGTISGLTGAVYGIAFSPNGHTVATGGADHTTRLWEADVQHAAARICALARPGLSRAEWDTYLPGVDYSPPC
ncbi:WD40 repeat protein [Kutzneria viridogrisea]|uniref:WD40 repeat protein n=1 Tax=Kutzneria viridogrisea TaxID=47990 RepID=A0ABR6BC37_9PSEU|nr:WD40 repeat protein [Kutzneria viridogrisea]